MIRRAQPGEADARDRKATRLATLVRRNLDQLEQATGQPTSPADVTRHILGDDDTSSAVRASALRAARIDRASVETWGTVAGKLLADLDERRSR